MSSSVEPWLRGPLSGVSHLTAPVLFALQQAREDLEAWTQDLPAEQFWKAPPGLASLGFQLKHIAGSIDRLLTYAKGESLSESQMAFLRAEKDAEGDRASLLQMVGQSIEQVDRFVRSLDESELTQPRTVGRKQLPTTVIGLLIHIAEHTQRHVGQAIVTIRALRGTGSAK